MSDTLAELEAVVRHVEQAGSLVTIDGVTKEQYGENVEENLKDLSERLRNLGYRPQPKRRSDIPKPGFEDLYPE